jgi:ribosomal protein S18 acetylase RimI-like enzyme
VFSKRKVACLNRGTGRFEVRTFEDGDETRIVDIFKKTYADYGGYSVRTPEYWRWCCLERPDVGKDGVLLALEVDSGEIVGYVVVGKSGYIWELAYDPDYDGEKTVSLLLDKALSYLDSAGATSVSFTAPQSDSIIRNACREHGFIPRQPPRMFLGVLNFRALIHSLADSKTDELRARFGETILIKITDPPFWVDNSILMQISRDGIKFDDQSLTSTIQLQTDCVTLSSLIFGNMSPLGAILHSKLKITPLQKIPTALKLLSELRIGAPWSFQLSELG